MYVALLPFDLRRIARADRRFDDERVHKPPPRLAEEDVIRLLGVLESNTTITSLVIDGALSLSPTLSTNFAVATVQSPLTSIRVRSGPQDRSSNWEAARAQYDAA